MSSLKGSCHCDNEKENSDLISKHEPFEESISDSNQALDFFNEINSIHEARLKVLEQETNQSDVYELKIETLKKWIDDLSEQNTLLIETVTQLEQEACKRVNLLESKLRQSATTAYEYISKVQKFNNQTELTSENNNVQNETLRGRMLNLENDVLNLLELIHRVRETGSWNTNGLQFTEVTTEDIFGTNLSNENETYQDLKTISNLPEESKTTGFLLVSCLRQELEEMKRQLYLKDKQILEVLKKFQHLRDNLSETSNKVTCMIKLGQGNSDSENNLLNKFKEISENINTKTNIISPQFLNISKNIDQTVEENDQRLQLISLKKQLLVSEERYHCLLGNKNDLEQEIGLVKRNLERALVESTDLNKQLEDKDKYTRDIRLALTSEVADKHDQIVHLRKDLQLLEEQCRRAEMQTLFKDDIIRELRKELKIAKAKLSLIERGSGDKSRNGKEKESVIEPERLERNGLGDAQKNSDQRSSFQSHIKQNSFENKIYDNRNSYSSKRKKLQVLYGSDNLNQARKKFLKKRSLSAPAKCRKEMSKPILRQRSLLNSSFNENEIVNKEDLRFSFMHKNMDMDDEYNKIKEKYEKISKENKNLLKEIEKIKNESLNINEKEVLIEEKNLLENKLIQTTSIYKQELSKRDCEIASIKYSNEQAQNDLDYSQNEIAKYQKRFEIISKENETFQLENSNLLQRVENQQKQMINQRTTIGNLQQALLMTKNQLEDIQSKDYYVIEERLWQTLCHHLGDLENDFQNCHDQVSRQDRIVESLRNLCLDLRNQTFHMEREVESLEHRLCSTAAAASVARTAKMNTQEELNKKENEIANLNSKVKMLTDLICKQKQKMYIYIKRQKRDQFIYKCRKKQFLNSLILKDNEYELLKESFAFYKIKVKEAEESLKGQYEIDQKNLYKEYECNKEKMESLLNEVCYVQIGLEEKENEIVRIKEEKDQTLLLMKKQEYAFKQEIGQIRKDFITQIEDLTFQNNALNEELNTMTEENSCFIASNNYKSNIIQSEILKLQREITEEKTCLLSKIKIIENQLSEQKIEKEEIQKQLAHIKRAFQTKKNKVEKFKEITRNLQIQKEELTNNLNQMKRNLQALQNKILQYESNKHQKEQQFGNIFSEIKSKHQETYEKQEFELEDQRDKIKDLTNERDRLINALEESQKYIKDYELGEQKIEDLQDELYEKEQLIKEFTITIEEIKQQSKKLHSEIREKNMAINDLNSQIELAMKNNHIKEFTYNEKLNDIQIKKQNLSDIIVHLENEIQLLKRSLEDKTTEIQNFQSKIELLNVQKQNFLKELQGENTTIKELKYELTRRDKEVQTQNKLIEHLYLEKQNMVPEETIAEIEQDRLSLIQTLNRVAIESEKEQILTQEKIERLENFIYKTKFKNDQLNEHIYKMSRSNKYLTACLKIYEKELKKLRSKGKNAAVNDVITFQTKRSNKFKYTIFDT